MTGIETQRTLEALASGLATDNAGVRRLLDRMEAHRESEALRDALAEAGARALLADSDAYLAAAIDLWHRERGGRAC
jgi:hypothetical protein